MGSDERPGCRRTRGATELAPGPGVVVRKRNTRVAFKSAAHPVRPCRRRSLRSAGRTLPSSSASVPSVSDLAVHVHAAMVPRRPGSGPPRCRARRRRTGLPLVRCCARTRDEGRGRRRDALSAFPWTWWTHRVLLVAPRRAVGGVKVKPSVFLLFTVSRLEYFGPAIVSIQWHDKTMLI